MRSVISFLVSCLCVCASSVLAIFQVMNYYISYSAAPMFLLVHGQVTIIFVVSVCLSVCLSV